MGLLSSLKGKQGGDAIRQSTTTATMHLLEQNRKFEVFMREKVAVLERQVAEDDGRLNRDGGGGEDDLAGEMDPAEDLGIGGPGESQDTVASSPSEGQGEVVVIGEGFGDQDEELELPEVPPPARPTVPVPPSPAPLPKASSAPPDWRAFLAGASTTPAPGAPAARAVEPPAGEGDQADAQGEEGAEEAPVEVEAAEPPAGEGDQVDAQGEEAAEEEEEEDGAGLFGMALPIVSVTSTTAERGQPPSSSAAAPAAAAPSAPPAAAKARPPAPASGDATPALDAGDQPGGWESGDLHEGQVGNWA